MTILFFSSVNSPVIIIRIIGNSSNSFLVIIFVFVLFMSRNPLEGSL